ncbi:MAG: hypothetical protein EOS84_10505 [Mesorhizobium sp.]|nr:MAG: hypothetical protein EOS84_10505 [Mesorhizobium sp.]
MVLICANDPPTEAGFFISSLLERLCLCCRYQCRRDSTPSVLPDISPTWGEIGCHPGFRQSPASR